MIQHNRYADKVIKINEKIRIILEKQKEYLTSKGINTNSLVFYGNKKDQYVNWQSFRKNIWNKILENLEGIELKNPYQMRHTFITLALKQVSVKDLARHCGNSPHVIMEHYAGVTRDFVMPDI